MLQTGVNSGIEYRSVKIFIYSYYKENEKSMGRYLGNCLVMLIFHTVMLQVVNYDPSSDNCNVRFLDYGGYYTFTSSDLKQIRSDFLALPFQVC